VKRKEALFTYVFRSAPALLCLFTLTFAGFNASPGYADSYFKQTTIQVDGLAATLMVDSPELWDKRDIILPWFNKSVDIVSDFYGRFPVASLDVVLIGIEGDEIAGGWVIGGASPTINIRVGKQISHAALLSDWVMVHEMAHLAFPDVKQRWIEEGIATYVESIARVMAGQLSAEHVWREFVRRMPQGQPKQGDLGLDHTPTWGRTYWGGAIFCLIADVEIRVQTNNRFGLRDALRGVLSSGYSMSRRADLPMVLALADKTVGVTVLSDLYQRHKDSATAFKLDKLWQALGIKVVGERVVLDPDAPFVDVRRRLMTGYLPGNE